MKWSIGNLRRKADPGQDRMSVGAARLERLKHAFWTLLISLGMMAAMLLEPIDWVVWNLQARVSNHPLSGELIYVRAPNNLADPNSPAQRIALARALDRSRAEGVSRVYIDTVFGQAAHDPRADRQLSSAIGRWNGRAYLVNRIDVAPESGHEEFRTIDTLAGGHATVWNGIMSTWPGFIWTMPYAYRTSSGLEQSMAASLARVRETSLKEFQIDYGFRSRAVPTITLEALANDRASNLSRSLKDKTLIIGVPAELSQTEMRLPGQFNSPPSFVPIFAAETLMSDLPRLVPAVIVVLIVTALLALGALCEPKRARKAVYALAITLPFAAAVVGPIVGLRVALAYSLPLLITFFLLRWRTNWKRRVAEIDPLTGQPSLRALALALEQPAQDKGYVIVAKIHGYETILSSLPQRQRAVYVLKLVERIRIGDPRMTVYVDGHHIAWTVATPTDKRLREHLEGLRAIFAAPVHIESRSIDVGITFGAASIADVDGGRSVAAAQAAAEATNEALEPIKLAEDIASIDPLWDLSLRARIDAAMEAGEVFCVYQPKIDISADRLVGVEALVRWEDPERGFIPPLHFVMQCEKAGRMEYLTRYVLQSACSAAKLLHFQGSRITMSVNISATLLTDMRIVGIVRNVLQATGLDPNYLVLEITETARIHDFAQARLVLRALKALGTQLSMDDFGVGAANFEALQALPFDEIKIDRQFVSQAASSRKARAIAASIVGLGTSARIAVVAEGAETDSDLQMLREIGCWQVQGYALARPMPLTNLLNFIEDASTNGISMTI